MDLFLDGTGTYSLHLQRLTAGARCGGSLTCDVPLSGAPATISARADTDLYSFPVTTANQKVHISLAAQTSTGGFFGPVWRLVNPAGNPVACEGVSDFAAGERDCGPLATGSYAVEVMDLFLDGTGTYSLHLQRLTAGARCGGTVPCNTPVTGEIEARADTNLYSFVANSSVNVNVTPQSQTGGFFSPGWRLVNPSGDPVVCGGASEFASGLRTCSSLAGGSYAVEVMDLGLDGTGTFVVTVTGSVCSSSPDRIESCGVTAAEPISCGTTKACQIDPTSDTDDFTFIAPEGAVASITIGDVAFRAGAPCWNLLFQGQTVFGPVCDGQGEVGPLAAGQYTIRTFWAPGPFVTTGPYGLSLQGVSESFNCGIAVAFGETKSDSIDLAGDTDTFSFDALRSEIVEISIVDVNSRAGSPCWALFTPDGSPVTSSCSTAQSDPLPETGAYTLKVWWQAGPFVNTGPYTVSLRKVPS
jgi:hypothetical protein